MLRTGVLLVALVFISGMFIESFAAENGWRQWVSGEVTAEVFKEGDFDRIEVDNINYTFMPDVSVWRVSRKNHGGYIETPITVINVYRGQNVEMLVHGFRIHQLKVTP